MRFVPHFLLSFVALLACPRLAIPATSTLPVSAAGEAGTLSSNAPRITGLQIGFAGHYKLGFWTPATVTIDGDLEQLAGRVEVDAPDSDGVTVTYSTNTDSRFFLGPENRRKVTILIRVGRVDAEFHVRLVSRKQTLAEETFYAGSLGSKGVLQGLASTAHLMLVVGPPVGLAEAMENSALDERLATRVVRFRNVADFPRTPLGYDGIDAITLSTGHANSPAAQFDLDQRNALLQWINLGGRVVLIAGEDGNELFGSDGPLAAFLPGRFETMLRRRQATAIEAFCDSRYPIRTRDGEVDIPVLRVAGVHGRVLIFEGRRPTDLPLVVREPRGFGEVTFIAFDLAAPPLADWAGRPHLLRRLFTMLSEDDSQSIESTSSGLTSLGYDDLAGQLRASLDVFPGIRAVPFALVTALAALYIALIGPLDYLIVRRWLARPALTWITLPTWVVLFTLLAWWLAREFKGDAVRVNHVELVDVDTATGRVRGTVWTHLYCPRIDTFNLSLSPCLLDGSNPPEAEAIVSWLGLPGAALGGMQGSGDDSPFGRGYQIDPARGTLTGLPLPVASTKSLTVQWTARTSLFVQSDLQDEGDGLLDGRVENASGCNLSNVRLLYGHRAWALGDLREGEAVDLASIRDPVSIRTVLTRGTTGVSVPGVSRPYDPASTNANVILDMMMWYQQVGGPSYVRLLHRYQAFCDMSDQLDMGRAVLTGVADAPGSRLEESNRPLGTADDKRLIVCRFVLPVVKE